MNDDAAKKYVSFDKYDIQALRLEIWLTPIIILFPLLVSGYLIYDWYTRGFLLNNPSYTGELLLGLIVLIGNIFFDIPFIKSLIRYTKQLSNASHKTRRE